MLGGMVVRYLSSLDDFQVSATTRDLDSARRNTLSANQVEWTAFDAASALTNTELLAFLGNFDWVINAIGITKPLIKDNDRAEVERAIAINAVFPQLIADSLERGGGRMIQIATDCTYSGARGRYIESDAHDALDVYGKTKSLGETYSPVVHHLRCSIIGPEWQSSRYLLEWFLNQAPSAEVSGFLNHEWNGVTTLHFAMICAGIIRSDLQLGHLQHVIPANTLTKYQLLNEFGKAFDRTDIAVRPADAATVVDRTLRTENEAQNALLWQSAGYDVPPTLEQMISEVVSWRSVQPAIAGVKP
jgi:dTDP-4-dehydrorhamnose reductase